MFELDWDRVVMVTLTSPFPDNKLLVTTLKLVNSWTPLI